MKVFVFTNKGGERKHNEDVVVFANCVMSGVSMANVAEIDIENTGKCFAVIDGMGGYEGGDMAAHIVASSLIKDMPEYNIPVENAKEKITNNLRLANELISQAVQENKALTSMGATIAGIVFCSDSILIFNCGDCRVYRKQGEYLEKLSHDHSVVQELFDRGDIDENDMRTHQKKNIITACVSSRTEDLNIFFRAVPYKMENQRFLLCSDGVWEALTIDEIEKCTSPQELANILLNLHKNCKDNISFIMIETYIISNSI